MFDTSRLLNRFILSLISWCLIGTYNYWIVTYQEANLLALTLPILLTIFLTIYLAIRLRTKLPSSWRKHPTMVLAGTTVGQAIGLFVLFYVFFIFPS
jgi:hypothetical protein